MRPLLAILVLLFPFAMHLPAGAKEKPKANTLTAKEAADGWILLFDGETTFGWKVDGQAMVADCTLILGGDRTLTTATRMAALRNFEMSFEARQAGNLSDRILFRFGDIQVRTLAVDYWVQHTITIDQANQYYSVGFRHDGGSGSVKNQLKPSQHPLDILIPVPERSRTVIRNVKLRPLGLKSIFNGKDLVGWREFPGKKSKFTVNDKGELNVKDGPGDLQTEGKWQDFVLRLEVFSNGKHLNSGVFFRCIPGQYQQGYEAQIRNQWQGEDRTKPVDFGTGGIQYRQAARKVVSNDREWFTMTIMAQGKHLAIWVNGYQTADFMDNRPVSDNARKGCKLGAGAISLQGHDPTTDLSFRNIRIAEIPRSKTQTTKPLGDKP
jgi:hypothetical protein